MPRIIFKDNNQAEFLRNIKTLSQLDINDLSTICGVAPRTFRDWLRGKFTISQKALLILTTELSLPLPKNIEIINNYWYAINGARKGGLRRLEMFGPAGTPEGRRKGGVNSQLMRKNDPEKYRLLGCNIRKEFKVDKPSIEFAEAAGIILGDGGISNYQLRITVSSLVDREYAQFIKDLFEKVFNEIPNITEGKEEHRIDLTISGIDLVEELERWGFVKGDKVKHQVGFPGWVWGNIDFQKACVRGLMDTDGGCYFHRHKVNGLVYRNFGMSFANKSLPLINSMAKVLTDLGIKFSLAKKSTRIYIYSFAEIKKYFSLIGSRNIKNWIKFNCYLNESTHRVLV